MNKSELQNDWPWYFRNFYFSASVFPIEYQLMPSHTHIYALIILEFS